ncbi:hypothetical protein H4S14_002039 [Agrobacterium vitis]|nr:hypothetical protein [Agrobacterium vitis]MBE1438294.1 hypothetical protein [Agrobacterium vitis]
MTQQAVPNAPKTNNRPLRTPQQRRRGFRLFMGLLLLFVLTIGLTVLLANGERNLRILTSHFEQMWPMMPGSDTTHVTPPSLTRSARLVPQTVVVPARVFTVPRLLDRGTFVRTIVFSGKAFCDRMNTAGLTNAGWAQSAYNPRIFDCSVEIALTPKDAEADAPSFFITARGDEAGQIAQIRWKIINVKQDPKIWSTYLKSIDLVAGISGWRDFSPQFDQMRALEPFETNHFGLGFKMSKEADDSARYNIMLMPENDGELQRKTRNDLNVRSRFSGAPLSQTLWPRQRLLW